MWIKQHWIIKLEARLSLLCGSNWLSVHGQSYKLNLKRQVRTGNVYRLR